MTTKFSTSFLLTLIVAVCLFLVVFIVIVGGIVTVRDKHYNFAEYIRDLEAVFPLIFGAALAAIGRAYIDNKNGKLE